MVKQETVHFGFGSDPEGEAGHGHGGSPVRIGPVFPRTLWSSGQGTWIPWPVCSAGSGLNLGGTVKNRKNYYPDPIK